VGEVKIAKLHGLRECTILRRINRFVVECLKGGRTIELHLRNTGRLNKLLVRGFKALYRPKLGGRTLGHLVAVETEGGYAIVDTAVQMSLSETAIERNIFHGLEGFEIGGRNVRYASSRFDYLLKKTSSRARLGVEVGYSRGWLGSYVPGRPHREGLLGCFSLHNHL